MLGQEEITYGDHPILSGKNKITKSMELLLLLLHRRETGIARSRLADALYGVEEVADAGNSLRVTLHRLRKLLLDAGMPEEDFITIREGVYRWSSREEMDVDVWKFRELIEGAEKETDEVRKAELLKAACQMYRGEFLPKLSGQEWALLAAASYKKMFLISVIAAFFIGCYDGFYGPGTGTFLLLVFTGAAKMDTRSASAQTKVINLSSNIAALVTFIIAGNVYYPLGLAAAACSVAGNYLGSGLVVHDGQKIVRPVVLVVLGILFIKILTGN